MERVTWPSRSLPTVVCVSITVSPVSVCVSSTLGALFSILTWHVSANRRLPCNIKSVKKRVKLFNALNIAPEIIFLWTAANVFISSHLIWAHLVLCNDYFGWEWHFIIETARFVLNGGNNKNDYLSLTTIIQWILGLSSLLIVWLSRSPGPRPPPPTPGAPGPRGPPPALRLW